MEYMRITLFIPVIFSLWSFVQCVNSSCIYFPECNQCFGSDKCFNAVNLTSSNISVCISKCRNAAVCMGFSYQHSTNLCQFYNCTSTKNVADIYFKPGNYSYFKRTCNLDCDNFQISDYPGYSGTCCVIMQLFNMTSVNDCLYNCTELFGCSGVTYRQSAAACDLHNCSQRRADPTATFYSRVCNYQSAISTTNSPAELTSTFNGNTSLPATAAYVFNETTSSLVILINVSTETTSSSVPAVHFSNGTSSLPAFITQVPNTATSSSPAATSRVSNSTFSTSATTMHVFDETVFVETTSNIPISRDATGQQQSIESRSTAHPASSPTGDTLETSSTTVATPSDTTTTSESSTDHIFNSGGNSLTTDALTTLTSTTNTTSVTLLPLGSLKPASLKKKIYLYPCQCVTETPFQNMTMDEIMEKIVSEVAINIRNTSASIRQKTSASDERPSSKLVGVLGILFLTGSIAVIVLFDIATLCRRMKA